jgi:uncharacterized protein
MQETNQTTEKVVDVETQPNVETITPISLSSDKSSTSNNNSSFDSKTTDQKFDTITDNSRLYSILMYCGGILFTFIPSLIVFLAVSEDKFVKNNAKESLNFHLNLLVINVAIFVFSIIVTGVTIASSSVGLIAMTGVLTTLLSLASWIICAVISIISSIKASKNILYKIPLIIRVIK